MSKSVATTDDSVAQFHSIEKVASALGQPSLKLNPGLPIPTTFNEEWEAMKKRTAETAMYHKPTAEKVATIMKSSTRFARFKTSLRSKKVGLVSIASTAAASSATISSLLIPTIDFNQGPLAMGIILCTCLIGGGAFVGGVGSTLFFVIIHEYDKRAAFVMNAFDSNYAPRISQWAQERYGITAPTEAWVAPGNRVAEDIAYVGVKDGQKIYCRETGSGLILSYDDGKELPVLIKELVNA